MCASVSIIFGSNENLLPDLGDFAVSFFLSHISQMISDLTYLSSSLVVVQVHQADRVLRSLSAFPPILSVNKSSREGDTKVNVVGAPGPLWIKDDERGYVEGAIADSRGVKINRLGENWGETRLISLLSLRL